MKTKSEQLQRRNVKATSEKFAKRTLFEVLGQLRIELPNPKKLTDAQLTTKLWKVIRALLGESVVLCNTDHLSDRELYTLLWSETLRNEFVISSHYTLHIDMTKTGADGGMPIYLKYYATEAQRKMYSDWYPDFEMPEPVEPPRRRDHLIPDIPTQVSNKHLN